jgi:hypothetical protein
MTPTGSAGRARRWESSWSMRPGRWTRAEGGRTRWEPSAQRRALMRATTEVFLVHLIRPTTRYRPGIAALRAAPAANLRPATATSPRMHRCAAHPRAARASTAREGAIRRTQAAPGRHDAIRGVTCRRSQGPAAPSRRAGALGG